jgi:hypothetical protein
MRGIRALQRLSGLTSCAESVFPNLEPWVRTLTSAPTLKEVLKEKIPAEQVFFRFYVRIHGR